MADPEQLDCCVHQHECASTSFRPSVIVTGVDTMVMCDQLATVDLRRLTEPAGSLTLDEMRRVDEALALVLDL